MYLCGYAVPTMRIPFHFVFSLPGSALYFFCCDFFCAVAVFCAVTFFVPWLFLCHDFFLCGNSIFLLCVKHIFLLYALFFAVTFLFVPWPFILCRGNICAVTFVGHRSFWTTHNISGHNCRDPCRTERVKYMVKYTTLKAKYSFLIRNTFEKEFEAQKGLKIRNS